MRKIYEAKCLKNSNSSEHTTRIKNLLRGRNILGSKNLRM